MAHPFEENDSLEIETARSEMIVKSDELVVERGEKYGPVAPTMKLLARLWSIRTGATVRPSDVCDMMEDLKWVRSKVTPSHDDNGPDAINYKAFAYALRERGM
jgi:hypothetical protein